MPRQTEAAESNPQPDGANAVGVDPMRAQSAPPNPSAQASLTQKVSGAFALTILQTVATKVAGLGAQIILARLLDPKDFGLIALAYTVTTFIGLFQQMGLRELLIQRQRHFARWADAAFWLSIASGIGAGALTAAVAPLAARAYHRSELIGLLLVQAASIPFANLPIVADARLRSQLRFGLLSGYGIFAAVFTAALSILFARLGFGAYSFVLPTPIEALIRAVVFWGAVKEKPRLRPQIRRWRYMVGDSALILGTYLCFTLITQGDNVLLGLSASDVQVGLYYFAFNLSLQGVAVLVGNLFNVLFPSFTHIQGDAVRQTNALLRAIRLLALVCIPLCFLASALSDPMIRLLFAPKWYGAIPIMRVLCIGMTAHVLGWTAHGLMQAQGRFRTDFVMSLWMAALLLGLVYTGIHAGAHWTHGPWVSPGFRTAVAASIAYAIMQPVYLYVVIRPAGRGAGDIIRACGGAYAASAAAAIAAYAAVAAVPPVAAWHLVRIAAGIAAGLIVYIPIAILVLPGTRELRQLVQQLAHRGRGPGKAAYAT